MKRLTHNPIHFGMLLPLCLFLLISLLPTIGYGQTTQTFSSSGSFIVPAGVTSVQVQAWGGGGAGGGCVGGAVFSAKAGGGGAGGSFTKVTNVSVTPGATITVTVGAGGTGVSQVAGNPGGTSTFASSTPVSAVGGGGGQIGNNGAGAGVTTGITNNGGSGGTAVSNNSGGGGGGAGSTGPGGNASGTTAGTAGPGGGGAGTPGLTASGDGTNATGIAGGGSGGRSASTISGTARKGGNGAPGQVLVTYTCPTYSLTSTTVNGPFCSATAATVTLSGTLPAGNYVVTYDLSGGNSATGLTANMTIASGNPGTGTFNTIVLTGGSTPTPTTINVTNLKSGVSCSSPIANDGNNAATVSVVIPPVSAGSPFTKTCVSNTSGAQIGEAQDADYNYSWTPVAGLSDATISNPIANPTSTTTYTVTKTNSISGCSATASVTVTVDNTLTVNAGADFTKTCVTNPSGKVIGEANVSGNTYSWSPTAGLSSDSVSNPTANPTVTTTYTVTKTNAANGCVATDDIVVTVNITTPVADAGADFTKTCVTNPNGAAIGEASQSGHTYSWTPTTGLSSSTVSNPTANPTVTTTYTVTKTNTSSGCTNTDTVTVTVNTTPPTVAALTGTQTVCVGATTIFASTTEGGVWSSSNTAIATVNAGIVTGVSAGTATISYTVTGANGCTTTVTRTVTVNPLPASVTINGATAVCIGSSTVLNGSATIPYIYTGIASDNFNGTPIYTSSGTGTIFAQKTSPATVGLTTITNNVDGSKFMMASQSSAFSNASTTSSLTSPSINTTNYSTLTLTFNHSFQKGDTGTNSAAVEVSTDGGSVFVPVKTYTTNQGANNNFIAETVNLNAYINKPNLKIRYTAKISTYFGTGWWAIENTVLAANVIPLYSWTADTSSGVNGLPSSATAPLAANSSITVNPSSDTNYTLVAQDPLTGCTQNSIPFHVAVNPIPSADAVSNVVYCNNTLTAAIPLTGSPSGVTFDISGGASIGLANASGVTAIPAFTTVAGTANVTITPKANGCTGSPVVYQVTVNPTPTVTNPGNQNYCDGATAASIVLNGTPSGITYDISGGASVGLADTTNVTSIPSFTAVPGNAVVSITPHANGCMGIPQTYSITVNPTPTVSTTVQNQTYCAGATASSIVLNGTPSGVSFNISGGASVGLADGNGVAAVPSFNTVAGNAIVTITPVINGCTGSSITYSITVNPVLTPAFTQVSPVCSGATLAALPTTSNNGVTGTWSPALNNTATTTYTFTPDSGQCTSSTLTTMTIVVNENVIYYADADGDTYGNLAVTVTSCTGAPSGYVSNSTDCDDTNVAKYQSALLYIDADGDGYDVGQTTVCYGASIPTGYSATTSGADCNDNNNLVYQSALLYIDADADGYDAGQTTVCYGASIPTGYSATTSGTDCNDNNNLVYQSALLYIDADADGYDAGQTTVCYGTSIPTGYSATTSGTDCNDNDAELTTNCTPASSIVNLTMFIQGYYFGTGTMASVMFNQDGGISSNLDVEMMTIELHDATTFALVTSATAMLHTNGTLSASFSTAPSGSYYIAVKGRNTVQTWSASPQTVGVTPLAYDFTTSASQAYGDNMAEVEPGVYGMYSGEFNADDFIEYTDYTIWETDANNFAEGDHITDLNGDGFVEYTDYTIWETNAGNFVSAIYPF